MEQPAQKVRPACRQAGFTLVETMLGTALLVIFFGAVAMVLQLAAQQIGQTRVKSTAQRLAQERLEQIRNMPYVDVGTVGGIPAGEINPEEQTVVNGQTFTITTDVVYIDDPYDQAAPTDTLPNDYKRVRVAVAWSGVFASRDPLVVWTDLAPRGTEGAITGGTIEITVTNAQLQKLVNAMVHIQADTATPSVNLDVLTDSDGKVVLPGSPVCSNECYRVSVTKTGHTTDRTYSRTEVANPNKPDLSVLKGGVSQVTLAIDTVSSVTFRAVRGAAFGYSGFQGVQFRLTGSKQIGRNVFDEPVFKYSALHNTGINGYVTVTNLEWDTYNVTIPLGSSVEFAGSTPFNPFALLPGVSSAFTMVVAASTANSLLVTLLDNNSASIASASVTLRNDGIGYLVTQATNPPGPPDQSQTYLPSVPATTSAYQLTVDAPGYDLVNTEATVSGDTVRSFILAPVEP
jgi:type II secretory pathway pseudopilin PulG